MTERPPPTDAAPRPPDAFLARLFGPAADALPAFDPDPLTDAARSPAETAALAAALGCPDLFLIDAPGSDRAVLAADLAAEAVRAGRRVLVVAPAPAADAVVGRLADRPEPVGRAVAPGEPVELLPPASAARTATAHAETARAVHRQKHADELARIAAAEGDTRDIGDTNRRPAAAALRDRHAAAVTERDAAVRSAAAALAAKAEEATRLRAELDAATAEAKKRHGAVGFLKGLFAKDDPAVACAALQQKLAAAEAAAVELAAAAERTADERAGLDAAHRAELEALIREEAARWHSEAEARAAELAAERNRLIAANGKAEAAVAGTVPGSMRVVVGPPAAVGADPLIPAAACRFDLLVVVDAEYLSEPEFVAAGRCAARWVLVGDASAAPRPGRPAGLFPKVWHRLHRRPWLVENGRLVARLTDGPRPGRLRAEPLADQPDIELRFAPGAGLILSEVVFPVGFALADAKAFLAVELGEIRLAPVGPIRWHEDADRLTACWPAADADWDNGWIDLGGGVRERIAGTGPDASTAAVAFDRAAGWDRPAAETWVARHSATARRARTAAVPRAATACPARVLAGVG